MGLPVLRGTTKRTSHLLPGPTLFAVKFNTGLHFQQIHIVTLQPAITTDF